MVQPLAATAKNQCQLPVSSNVKPSRMHDSGDEVMSDEAKGKVMIEAVSRTHDARYAR
jgi:hypothetical protein